MRSEVMRVSSLGLPAKYEGRVQLCYEAANELIPASEIYLYGQYANNQIFSDSLLKILVLVGDNCSRRELKTLGWEVEELIYKISNEAFPFEITVLSMSLYYQCYDGTQQMREMMSGKKNLRKICWIDK